MGFTLVGKQLYCLFYCQYISLSCSTNFWNPSTSVYLMAANNQVGDPPPKKNPIFPRWNVDFITQHKAPRGIASHNVKCVAVAEIIVSGSGCCAR